MSPESAGRRRLAGKAAVFELRSTMRRRAEIGAGVGCPAQDPAAIPDLRAVLDRATPAAIAWLRLAPRQGGLLSKSLGQRACRGARPAEASQLPCCIRRQGVRSHSQSMEAHTKKVGAAPPESLEAKF